MNSFMEGFLQNLFAGFNLPILFIIIGICIYVLVKSADILVQEAVTLSAKWGVSKILIGATIVSIGTTLPEAGVSVFAILAKKPEVALGNAVGSIICDTGLVLGLAAILSSLPLVPNIVNRQGKIQVLAGIALVLFCIPFTSINMLFIKGGNLPQYIGFMFLLLLFMYLWTTVRIFKKERNQNTSFDKTIKVDTSKDVVVILKLLLGVTGVVLASHILIPAVTETAFRLHVPESIIAATLIAFGTSLPELVTALTAVKKGHGELAVGNVIGADILNVLFVTGAAASVSKTGIDVAPRFFYFLFPAMLLILFIFRIGVFCSKDSLKRPFGFLLLSLYLATVILGYLL